VQSVYCLCTLNTISVDRVEKGGVSVLVLVYEAYDVFDVDEVYDVFDVYDVYDVYMLSI